MAIETYFIVRHPHIAFMESDDRIPSTKNAVHCKIELHINYTKCPPKYLMNRIQQCFINRNVKQKSTKERKEH